jgi:hypothetical protein
MLQTKKKIHSSANRKTERGEDGKKLGIMEKEGRS